ncbi:MAG: DoxX family membrane protein [Candidatus Aminicenantes bacterium]|jgi:thiosulfate dehydrogenase [quinone] large subunit
MRAEIRYSGWQVFALVLLRVMIGWHFLYEGLSKLIDPQWSAANFLLESKWIFAGLYKAIAANPSVLSVVDALNTWGLILIGAGLMLGCFSRIATVAGMVLILLYYFSTPPFIGLYYAIPSEGNYLMVNKNLIEMTALFVLLLFPTGHIIGLDRFFHKLRAT